jgi:hypothetical protein
VSVRLSSSIAASSRDEGAQRPWNHPERIGGESQQNKGASEKKGGALVWLLLGGQRAEGIQRLVSFQCGAVTHFFFVLFLPISRPYLCSDDSI